METKLEVPASARRIQALGELQVVGRGDQLIQQLLQTLRIETFSIEEWLYSQHKSRKHIEIRSDEMSVNQ